MKSPILYTLKFVLLLFVLSDCSKSTDPTPSVSGTWNVIATSTAGCTDPSNNSSTGTTCTATNCIKLIFSGNNLTISLTISGSTSSSSGTYSISSNKMTISSGGSTEVDTFSVTGNVLTITSPKDATTGCIYTITCTKA